MGIARDEFVGIAVAVYVQRDMDECWLLLLFQFNTTASNYCHFRLKMVSFISLITHTHTQQ